MKTIYKKAIAVIAAMALITWVGSVDLMSSFLLGCALGGVKLWKDHRKK